MKCPALPSDPWSSHLEGCRSGHDPNVQAALDENDSRPVAPGFAMANFTNLLGALLADVTVYNERHIFPMGLYEVKP